MQIAPEIIVRLAATARRCVVLSPCLEALFCCPPRYAIYLISWKSVSTHICHSHSTYHSLSVLPSLFARPEIERDYLSWIQKILTQPFLLCHCVHLYQNERTYALLIALFPFASVRSFMPSHYVHS